MISMFDNVGLNQCRKIVFLALHKYLLINATYFFKNKQL